MAALGLGTYGAHVFKPKNPTYKDVWHTASLYHLVRNYVTNSRTGHIMQLLCQYETGSVLKFLETFENYRVEHCLRLCQKYGIVDATASSMKSFNTVLQKKEVNDILDIVHTCIGLCQRNSPRMDFDESESLWFRLLDSFCEPLIDSYSTRINSEGKFNTENNSVHRIRWKLSRFQKGAHILRKLFSLFIKAIVEGMIGYVRLPTIMMKLLSDNGSQEFGDFKLTIL